MAALKGQPCTSDLDCVSFLVCFPNTTQWVQEEFGRSTCWCDGGKVYVGDACNEVNPAWGLSLFFLVISFLAGTTYILISLWSLFGLYRVTKKHKSRDVSLCTPLVQTAILCFLLGIILITGTVVDLHCATTFDWVNNEGKDKNCPFIIFYDVMFVLSFLVGFLTVLNVSVTWISIVVSVHKLKTGIAASESTRRIIRIVRIGEVIYLLALVISNCIGNVGLTTVLLLPFTLMLIVSYCAGGYYLSKLLYKAEIFQRDHGGVTASNGGSTESGSQSLHRAVRHVRWTMIGVVTNMILMMIFCCAAVLLVAGRNGGSFRYGKGGWDSSAILLLDAGILCGEFAQTSVVWFVWVSARSKIAKLDGSTTSKASAAVVGAGGGPPAPAST